MRLVASQPAANEGTECTTDDPPECGVPINTDIILRFDRYLRPASAVRQSIEIFTGSTSNWAGVLLPEYDVVERVVVYRLTQALEPGTLYTIRLRSPDEESRFGFQAFDGAPLAEGEAPLTFNFFTRRSRSLEPGIPLEASPSCERIAELFREAGCASSACHSGTAPPMGLELGSVQSVAGAVGQVARQTELGASVGRPLRNPDRFGLQMPLMDPGQPANSYLLYKLLLSERSHWLAHDEPDLCNSRYQVPLGPTCIPPQASELVRLREWAILGDPMPPAGTALFRPDLRELQRFIAAGANCR